MKSIIKREFYRRTNLARFIILKVLQTLLFIFKALIIYLFPFVLLLLVGVLCAVLKISLNPGETVSITVFSISIGVYTILLGFVLSLLLSKEQYFKRKQLAIFGNVKFLGIYPIYLLIIFDTSYVFFALYYLIISDFQACFIQSLSILLYSILLIIFVVLFYIKSDKNRFKRYLKNIGIFKKYHGSSLMEQDLLFACKHNKTYEKCLKLSVLSKLNQCVFNDEIPEVIEKNIKFKKSVFNENVELLIFYLDNYAKYVQTDMDITFLISFFKSINTNVINPLISANEFDLVEQVFISMLGFVISIYNSPYYKRNNKVFKNFSLEKCVGMKEKDKGLLVTYNQIFLKQLLELLNCVLGVIKDFENLKTDNVFIKNIQERILPEYEKINKETE